MSDFLFTCFFSSFYYYYFQDRVSLHSFGYPEFTVWTRLTSNSWTSPCPCLPAAGIQAAYHRAWDFFLSKLFSYSDGLHFCLKFTTLHLCSPSDPGGVGCVRTLTELRLVFTNLTLCGLTMATLIRGCVWTIAEIPSVIKEMLPESICIGKDQLPELSLERGKWRLPGAFDHLFYGT